MINLGNRKKSCTAFFHYSMNTTMLLMMLTTMSYIALAFVHRNEICMPLETLKLPLLMSNILKCAFVCTFAIGGSFFNSLLQIGGLYFFAHVHYQIAILNILVEHIPYEDHQDKKKNQEEIKKRLIFCIMQDRNIRR